MFGPWISSGCPAYLILYIPVVSPWKAGYNMWYIFIEINIVHRYFSTQKPTCYKVHGHWSGMVCEHHGSYQTSCHCTMMCTRYGMVRSTCPLHVKVRRLARSLRAPDLPSDEGIRIFVKDLYKRVDDVSFGTFWGQTHTP